MHYHAAAERAIGLPELPLGGEPLTMLTVVCPHDKNRKLEPYISDAECTN